ncbi:MAG: hypothetical protein WCH11_07660 [Bdellovibrio sp.]
MRKDAGQVSLLGLALLLFGAGLLLLHLGFLQAEISWLSFHHSCHQLLSQWAETEAEGVRPKKRTSRQRSEKLAELRESMEALPHILRCSLQELSHPADLQAQCVWQKPWRHLLVQSPFEPPQLPPPAGWRTLARPGLEQGLKAWDWALSRQLQCRSPKITAQGPASDALAGAPH